MRVVFGGHWTAPPPGWTVLTQSQQDITKPLALDDGSLDAVFTEHVIEHVPFASAVSFFKEAHRCLRPGGAIRTVAPMLDCFSPPGPEYVESSLRPWFREELGLLDKAVIETSPHALVFLMNSMFRLHGHAFVWTRPLMVEVLRSCGFVDVRMKAVSESDYGIALERVARGGPVGDPESGVVEARRAE